MPAPDSTAAPPARTRQLSCPTLRRSSTPPPPCQTPAQESMPQRRLTQVPMLLRARTRASPAKTPELPPTPAKPRRSTPPRTRERSATMTPEVPSPSTMQAPTPTPRSPVADAACSRGGPILSRFGESQRSCCSAAHAATAAADRNTGAAHFRSASHARSIAPSTNSIATGPARARVNHACPHPPGSQSIGQTLPMISTSKRVTGLAASSRGTTSLAIRSRHPCAG